MARHAPPCTCCTRSPPSGAGLEGTPAVHLVSAQPAMAGGIAGTSLSSSSAVSTPPTQTWTLQSPATGGTFGVGVPSDTSEYAQVPVAPSQLGVWQGPMSGQSEAFLQETVHVPDVQTAGAPARTQAFPSFAVLSIKSASPWSTGSSDARVVAVGEATGVVHHHRGLAAGTDSRRGGSRPGSGRPGARGPVGGRRVGAEAPRRCTRRRWQGFMSSHCDALVHAVPVDRPRDPGGHHARRHAEAHDDQPALQPMMHVTVALLRLGMPRAALGSDAGRTASDR